MARYANRQSDPAQTRGFCGFDSHPCYLLTADFPGWCSSRRPVKPLPSSGEAEGERFDSFATHWQFSMKVRSSIGTGHQPLKLKRRVRLPHGPLHWTTRRVAELVDARASEARAPEACEFESSPDDWLIDR